MQKRSAKKRRNKLADRYRFEFVLSVCPHFLLLSIVFDLAYTVFISCTEKLCIFHVECRSSARRAG